MNVLDCLGAPSTTRAILCDMDGVLIDSLGFDLANCSRILKDITGIDCEFSRDVIRDGFALSPDDFWHYLAAQANITLGHQQLHDLIELFEAERRSQAFPVLPGVTDLITATRQAGLKLAVVSNTPVADVQLILRNAGLDDFDTIIGNDGASFRKKPFPDGYLRAAEIVGAPIDRCVVIEDSLIGVEAGFTAGAYTIGVATGGTSLTDLSSSGFCHSCRESLEGGLPHQPA